MTSIVLLWALQAASAEDRPPGEPVDNAVGVELTAAGLDAASALLPAVVPIGATDLDPVSDSGGFSCVNYAYSLTDAWVGMEMVSASLVPQDGHLEVLISMDVWLNDSSDKFTLWYELFCSDSTCPGYVDPFRVDASVPITFEVVGDGTGAVPVDVVVGEPVIDNQLEGSDIHLDCSIGDIETVLEFFGFSLYELIISAFEDQLLSSLTDQVADIEAQLEEALAQAHYDDVVDVNGIPLSVKLYPQEIDVVEEGMEIWVWGHASAPPADCVAEHDPGGSLRTDEDPVAVGTLPSGTHAGILVTDDFADQALYALWRGGLLCYDIDGSVDLGLPVNASLLGIVGGDAFKNLFGDEGPLLIRTDPRAAPTALWDGSHDATIAVNELGVDFYAELDYRTVHALGVTVDTDLGADFAFDGETGGLSLVVALDEGALHVVADDNEFAPEASAQIESTLGGLLGTVLESLLGPAIGDLAFTMPSFEGFGLTSLEAQPLDENGHTLGLLAGIGPVPYGSGSGCGCGEEGSGCAEGSECSALGPGSALWGGLVALVALRRRRRV